MPSDSANPAPPDDPRHLSLPVRAAPILRRVEDGRLAVQAGEQWIPVTVRPCFPWTHPRQWLSLRDEKGEERALVRDLESLEPAPREVLARALAEARFTFEIEAIESIEADFDLRIWKVRTAQGARRFLTEWDTFPRTLPDGSLVIEDQAGDLFRIANPDAMDAKSAALLWSYRG